MSCGSSVPEPLAGEDTRIPVTVVTGFLGSGKTTLVNNILHGSHGKRIAVIENEFGEVGIDSGLVLNAKEEVFEMNNGCICCTVRGDLIRLLGKLLRRKNRFDAFLIETTGLADPAPVAQTFFADDEIKANLRLDAIVTVVDAEHLATQLDLPREKMCVNEASEQIACADVVILNKVDRVGGEAGATEARRRVREINGLVKILPTSHSAVDLREILDIHAFDVAHMLTIDPEFLKIPEEGLEGHHDHEHDHSVSSVGLEAPDGPLDESKAAAWLGKVLDRYGDSLYRCKGILAVPGSDAKLVFHGVHSTLRVGSSGDGVGGNWREGEPRVSRAVFIGRDLDRADLERGWRECVVVASLADGAARAATAGSEGSEPVGDVAAAAAAAAGTAPEAAAANGAAGSAERGRVSKAPGSPARRSRASSPARSSPRVATGKRGISKARAPRAARRSPQRASPEAAGALAGAAASMRIVAEPASDSDTGSPGSPPSPHAVARALNALPGTIAAVRAP